MTGTELFLPPGAAATLTASCKSAVDKGESWVGYNWEPSYVTENYDMALLKEPEYTEERWNNG
ncbi:hypothetical protein GH741_13060 [Aquibacillus halophilus]|uniref:ABC-type glycine betaine transport system substrate-binding domain-containing protein n=1 Tax=Aquibacillus halophilus TaxID=930132 RepID=A0A6A8DIN1_9BACI|nr:glycine betaine ABC transporter substrate-binding protein [Aquibacillus halophilus]MRH43611.1 hypothetical protein [Aquibacillus halophilus]